VNGQFPSVGIIVTGVIKFSQPLKLTQSLTTDSMFYTADSRPGPSLVLSYNEKLLSEWVIEMTKRGIPMNTDCLLVYYTALTLVVPVFSLEISALFISCQIWLISSLQLYMCMCEKTTFVPFMAVLCHQTHLVFITFLTSSLLSVALSF